MRHLLHLIAGLTVGATVGTISVLTSPASAKEKEFLPPAEVVCKGTRSAGIMEWRAQVPAGAKVKKIFLKGDDLVVCWIVGRKP